MKTLALVVLSVILSVCASPLGDRAVFRRHNGIPLSRRYILQSRQNAPAACAAIPSNTTTSPGVSSTDLPAIGDPSVANNSTTTAPSVASNSTTTAPSVASNSTITDPSAASNSTTTAPSVASNTTVTPTNSTTTTNSTAARRFWARDDSFSGDSFSGDSFSGDSFSGDSFSGDSSDFSSSSIETDFSEEITFEESISTYIQTWENLCFESGGDIYTDDPCRTYGSFYGIDALLEYADPCDQQDIADGMITFAKSHGITNRDALINFALGYRQHSRHSVEILGTMPSSLYCLTPPVNSELNGICNEQPSGVNPGLYGSPNAPLVPFGSDGTCPLGMTADTSSCSCVASSGGSSDSSATPTDTVDSSLPTDSSTDASSTDTASSSLSTDTSTNSTSTDAAAANAASNSSSTDTALASAATIPPSTDTAAATSVVVTPTNTGGVNFQPTDISGNVNDPSGRRR